MKTANTGARRSITDLESTARSPVGLTLAEALRYATRWRGKTVVIKLGGSVLEQASAATLEDVVLLQHAGLKPVLVHGGGIEISRMLDRLGHTPRFIDGLRVTDADTMEVVEMVLTGRVNKRLVAGIEAAGGRAAGLSGKDGSLLIARPHPSAGSLGHVGEVERVAPEVLEAMVEGGFVPVVCSIGIDRAGTTYNLNADDAAAALAVTLHAEKLILLTDVELLALLWAWLNVLLVRRLVFAFRMSNPILNAVVPLLAGTAYLCVTLGATVFVCMMHMV